MNVGQFYIMKSQKSPTIINCVEELKNFTFVAVEKIFT